MEKKIWLVVCSHNFLTFLSFNRTKQQMINILTERQERLQSTNYLVLRTSGDFLFLAFLFWASLGTICVIFLDFWLRQILQMSSFVHLRSGLTSCPKLLPSSRRLRVFVGAVPGVKRYLSKQIHEQHGWLIIEVIKHTVKPQGIFG